MRAGRFTLASLLVGGCTLAAPVPPQIVYVMVTPTPAAVEVADTPEVPVPASVPSVVPQPSVPSPVVSPSMAPSPTPTPTPAPSTDACVGFGFTVPHATGEKRHGAFAGVDIPEIWVVARDGGAIFDAITHSTPNEGSWACFQQEFPEASQVYADLLQGGPGDAPLPEAPSPPPSSDCMLGLAATLNDLGERRAAEERAKRVEIAQRGLGKTALDAALRRIALKYSDLADAARTAWKETNCAQP